MAERDRFELDLAAALRSYLEELPTQVRPTELARHFAVAYPHRRIMLGRRFGLTPAIAWALLLVGLLLALVVGSLAVGAWRRDLAIVIAPLPTATAAPTTAAPTATPASPTGTMTTARVRSHGHPAREAAASSLPGAGMREPLPRPRHTTRRPARSARPAQRRRPASTPRRPCSPTAASSSPEALGNSLGRDLRPDNRLVQPDRLDGDAPRRATPRPCSPTAASSSPEAWRTLASAEIYDPATGTFSPTGSMAEARGPHTATLLADGRVLVVGGGIMTASRPSPRPRSRTQRPARSARPARLAVARYRHTATLLPTAASSSSGAPALETGVLPCLGRDLGPDDGHVRPDGLADDGARAPHRHAARRRPRPRRRGLHTATDAASPRPRSATRRPARSARPARWRRPGSAHRDPAADGRVLVAGGEGVTSETLASAEIYDPTTGTFSPPGP